MTGLYQMRARYYAPGWGRFLTPDPLGVALTGNPYAFVGNRPGDFWDPFGLSPVANPNGRRMNSNPFTPNRDPVAHWLLTSDNWITNNMIQNDRALEFAQNGSLALAGTALTIATGGMAFEAYASAGGTAALRMGAVRAGMVVHESALAEAGATGVGGGSAYMATGPVRGQVVDAAGDAARAGVRAGAGTGAGQAVAQGADEAAEGAAQRATVTFGRDASQVHHASDVGTQSSQAPWN
jgi:uncharacterized protein RhaS with RHS repeats